MANNNSMVTSLNDIPIKTNNIIESDELNDPTIKELFKDYQQKNNIREEKHNYQINNDDNIDDNNMNQEQYNTMMQEQENEMIIQQQQKEHEFMIQQQHDMMMEKQYNEKKFNNDFEKEMDNLMDDNTFSNLENKNLSNNDDLFTKQNIKKLGVILLVFVIITNLNIIKLFHKYIPENIYDILLLYDKYIYYIISIIIIYIIYYFKYL